MPTVERLAQRYTNARRNQVIDGLLDSIEAQALTSLFEHIVEGVSETGRVVDYTRPLTQEDVEARRLRARAARMGTMEGSLQVIGLMVRNEKRARGLPLMPIAEDAEATVERIK